MYRIGVGVGRFMNVGVRVGLPVAVGVGVNESSNPGVTDACSSVEEGRLIVPPPQALKSVTSKTSNKPLYIFKLYPDHLPLVKACVKLT